MFMLIIFKINQFFLPSVSRIGQVRSQSVSAVLQGCCRRRSVSCTFAAAGGGGQSAESVKSAVSLCQLCSKAAVAAGQSAVLLQLLAAAVSQPNRSSPQSVCVSCAPRLLSPPVSQLYFCSCWRRRSVSRCGQSGCRHGRRQPSERLPAWGFFFLFFF